MEDVLKDLRAAAVIVLCPHKVVGFDRVNGDAVEWGGVGRGLVPVENRVVARFQLRCGQYRSARLAAGEPFIPTGAIGSEPQRGWKHHQLYKNHVLQQCGRANFN